MVRSMTGFGRGEFRSEKRSVTAEIRSVNHRYCDISVKIPRRYAFAEEKIKNEIRKYALRGKIDCMITIENLEGSDVEVHVNSLLARQYADRLRDLKQSLGLEGEVSLELLSSFPDVLRTDPAPENEEELLHDFLEAVNKASRNLLNMREIEGEKLAEDLKARGQLIRSYVDQIDDRDDQVPMEYAERLNLRIQELLKETGAEIPEDRLAVETAVFADKCSITEEITRLRSHLDQLSEILEDEENPKGKRLDFLVQEMNREANTIGSKANDLTITRLMLKVKAEVEKIREQVQNIE
ncbi:MAG: YicC family protein [Eubacteriales bacterium]|nr:YicC family protein [Eubacteriales bacterium]